MFFFEVLFFMAFSMLSGAVFGLIPFFVGKHLGKPNLGQLGWKWTMVSGLLFLQVPVAIGFVVAIIVRNFDYYPPASPTSHTPYAGAPVPPTAPAGRSVSLGLTCLSGPLKGRTYPVREDGVMIGRDYDCAIRFDGNTPGISRHHCTLRWQNGSLLLTDLGSAFGTYLADGRKLPPQYPTQVGAGSRFYLGNTANLFQIVIIN